jgi:hypothetical protein
VVPLEVQSDFVEQQARTSPLQALAEFVWNAVDADATKVEIVLERNELGLQHIIVRDNGTGIPYAEAPTLFGQLGGSWKKMRGLSRKEERVLHGRDGRGRFKAVVLGRVADWHVTYEHEGELRSYEMSIISDNLKQVRITEEGPPEQSHTGVQLVISEPEHDFRSLQSEETTQALAEIFAPYLTDYRDVAISLQGVLLDPSSAIVNRSSRTLPDVTTDDHTYPVWLEMIEWRRPTKRALYLCNESGFPFTQVDARFQVGDHHFSAYLKSPLIGYLNDENLLEAGELNTVLVPSIEAARQHIKVSIRFES